MQLTSTAVVRLGGHAPIVVGSTAAGSESTESSASIGRTLFPPAAATIVTTGVPRRPAVIGTAANAAPAAAPPPSFSWLRLCDARTRVQQLHGADTRCLGWYALNPPNQLTCGSCWSFAVTGALGDRARIATNIELPPLSVTYMLACGNLLQADASPPNPCAGGQAAQGAALAISMGIPCWLQADYAWEADLAARSVEPNSFAQIPEIGKCLGSSAGVLVGATDTKHDTAAQRAADQSVETSSAEIKRRVKLDPKAPMGPKPGSYVDSGVPPQSRLLASPAATTAPERVYASANSFTLLDTFADVSRALWERGPCVGQYFVPADFETGWADGHAAWRETGGVYAHSLDLALYSTGAEHRAGAAATLEDFRSKAAFAFTGDAGNPVSSDKSSAKRLSQLSMGGHAVVVVGYAAIDLWTAPKDPALAAVAVRIRPTANPTSGCPVYKVRNSWGASGPFVDGLEGVWMMLAAGDYDVSAPGAAGAAPPTTKHTLGKWTAFDQPISISDQRFGGVVELDYDAAHGGTGESLAAAMRKFKQLAAAPGDCGCSVDSAPPQPAVGAAATSVSVSREHTRCPRPPVMTPAGWIFMALALALLIVGIVMLVVDRRR